MNINGKWLTLAMLTLSPGVAAQQQIPGAGSQLRQIAPTPVPPRTAPEIRIAPVGTVNGPSSGATAVSVRVLQVTGATVYPVDELLRVAGFKAGAMLSLTDLQAMASRITEY